jgi:hypothetical protein
MSKTAPPPDPRQAAPAPQPPAAYGAAAMTDLEGLISWSSSEVLNAASNKGIDTGARRPAALPPRHTARCPPTRA